VDRKHRTLGQHVQVGIGDDHGDFDDAVGIRIEPGHFHVDPDQIEFVRPRRRVGWRLRFSSL